MIGRREVITVLGGATIAWPLAAFAQQSGKIYRIGFLANDPTIPSQPAGKAFANELRAKGFVEGQNILIDWRFAEGKLDRYGDLAATLVKLQMDLIVASTESATTAVKQATKNIPIVMLNVSDPIGSGVVGNLASPEGNVTGLVQDESAEIAGKRLQLLKDAVPQTIRVAVLMNPNSSGYVRSQWKILELAARSLNVKLTAVFARQKENSTLLLQRSRQNVPMPYTS